MGPARAQECIPGINPKIWIVLGRKTYHIFRFILEPDPWGWGHRALGLGASQGPRVHPRNKPENMEGGDQDGADHTQHNK